jgi:hypothetical protein
MAGCTASHHPAVFHLARSRARTQKAVARFQTKTVATETISAPSAQAANHAAKPPPKPKSINRAFTATNNTRSQH